MGIMPIPRLVIGMAVPLMLSLLVQSLYNIVDSIFVARIGETALTATSLAYPVQILMIALAVGTGVGINALLSRLLGARQLCEVRQATTTGLLLAVGSSLIFVLLGLFAVPSFVGRILRQLSAHLHAAVHRHLPGDDGAALFAGRRQHDAQHALANRRRRHEHHP